MNLNILDVWSLKLDIALDCSISISPGFKFKKTNNATRNVTPKPRVLLAHTLIHTILFHKQWFSIFNNEEALGLTHLMEF